MPATGGAVRCSVNPGEMCGGGRGPPRSPLTLVMPCWTLLASCSQHLECDLAAHFCTLCMPTTFQSAMEALMVGVLQ